MKKTIMCLMFLLLSSIFVSAVQINDTVTQAQLDSIDADTYDLKLKPFALKRYYNDAGKVIRYGVWFKCLFPIPIFELLGYDEEGEAILGDFTNEYLVIEQPMVVHFSRLKFLRCVTKHGTSSACINNELNASVWEDAQELEQIYRDRIKEHQTSTTDVDADDFGI